MKRVIRSIGEKNSEPAGFFLKVLPLLTMLPVIHIGAIAMRANEVSASLYMQNILCGVILGLCAFPILKCRCGLFKTSPTVPLAGGILALLLSFAGPQAEGVHRWVSLGPINLYVSAIALPVILISLGNLLKQGKTRFAAGSIACVCALLALQPDASMVSAFGAASIVLAWKKLKDLPRILLAALLVALAAITWIRLDTLVPVEYVEGMLKLLLGMGLLWLIAGLAALAVTILPFFVFKPKKHERLSVGLGVFYTVNLLAAATGHFAVPLMGYGLSPIIGYFISIMWLTRMKKIEKMDEV